MTISSNPSYQALATLAAQQLGNPAPSIVKAILAQWQCELGNIAYPPTRNNPGNVARGWAQGVGIPFTVSMPNPQPGNPIVTFSSPSDGARAYAAGIRTFARYGLARAAVHRGDGRAFLIALTAAGYGTSATCALGVYGGEKGSLSPGTIDGGGSSGSGSSSGGSGGVVLAIINATSTASCGQVTIITPNPLGRSSGVFPIPRDSIGQPCVACAPGFVPAIIGVTPIMTIGGYTPPEQVPGLANACVRDGTHVGDHAAADPGPVIGGLFDGLVGAVAPLLINGGVLVLVLVLAYSGLRDVLAGAE